MATLGNVPAEAYTNTVKDSFSGNGSATAFTMSLPTVTNDVRVVVENVIQDPTVAYSVSGTTLTFTSAPPTGTNNIYVVHLGPAVMTTVPPAEIADATTFASSLTVQGAFTSVGIDDNADAVALTIDSSENVLIGKTSADGTGSTGHDIRATGLAYHTVDGGDVTVLNRLNSDGGILSLRKDGAAVGSIGVTASDILYLANPDGTGCGLNFDGDNPKINPTNGSGAGTNGIVDLGWSGGRFKDLYTSGGVYLGGTGAANYLDDYEFGTWTPSLQINSSGGGITYNHRSASYTKIGKLVFVEGDMALSSKGSNGGNVNMSGLPFTVYDRTGGTSLDGGSSLCAYFNGTANVYSPIGLLGAGGTTDISMFVAFASGNSMSSNLTNGRITDTFSIRFSLTYRIA